MLDQTSIGQFKHQTLFATQTQTQCNLIMNTNPMNRICHTPISHWLRNLGYIRFELTLQLIYIWCLNCLITPGTNFSFWTDDFFNELLFASAQLFTISFPNCKFCLVESALKPEMNSGRGLESIRGVLSRFVGGSVLNVSETKWSISESALSWLMINLFWLNELNKPNKMVAQIFIFVELESFCRNHQFPHVLLPLMSVLKGAR